MLRSTHAFTPHKENSRVLNTFQACSEISLDLMPTTYMKGESVFVNEIEAKEQEHPDQKVKA